MKSPENPFSSHSAGRDVHVGLQVGDVSGGLEIRGSARDIHAGRVERSDDGSLRVTGEDGRTVVEAGRVTGPVLFNGAPLEYDGSTTGESASAGISQEERADNWAKLQEELARHSAETSETGEPTDTTPQEVRPDNITEETDVSEIHPGEPETASVETLRNEVDEAYKAAVETTTNQADVLQGHLPPSGVRISGPNGMPATPGSTEPLTPTLDPRQITGREHSQPKSGKVKSFFRRYLRR